MIRNISLLNKIHVACYLALISHIIYQELLPKEWTKDDSDDRQAGVPG
jgi:hypothetical protein